MPDTIPNLHQWERGPKIIRHRRGDRAVHHAAGAEKNTPKT